MPDIIVQRGAGTRQGEDVIDPLLTTVSACLARGQMELDEHTEGLQPVTVSCLYRDGLLLGDVVQIYDEYYGTIWYGKITSIRHKISSAELLTDLQVKRSTDFEIQT